MALCGILMYTLPILMTIMLALRRVNRYSKEEYGEHIRDYPWSPAGNSSHIGQKSPDGL
jgi:hypothetical protein